MAAQFDANVRGSLFWSASDRVARSAVDGNQVAANTGSMNFRIFWDGDLQEELLDGGTIDKWNGNGTSRLFTPWNFGPSSTCNGSKNTPNLLADLLGDWREELILHNGTDQLVVYTTNIATPYRMPTLMHDHTYRMGICWQNTAYNQPPHLGYYLPDYIDGKLTGIETIKTDMQTEKAILYDLSGRRLPTSDFNSLPKGIYIIKQGANIIKYNKK
jgi:rhamnogalacturonan endolyase